MDFLRKTGEQGRSSCCQRKQVTVGDRGVNARRGIGPKRDRTTSLCKVRWHVQVKGPLGSSLRTNFLSLIYVFITVVLLGRKVVPPRPDHL